MFSRMSRTWELTKQSFAVIAADKRLLIFPVLSGIAVIIVSASFAIPVFMSGTLDSAKMTGTDYAVLFLFYFANYFVVLFFNCALVACANVCLSGGHATVGDGLKAAWSRLPRIFMWSLVAATVGFLIRMIEERAEKIGRIVAWLLGTAWTLMTYFIVPVLMFEDAGVVDSVKRSTAVLKKTWGEEITSGFSFGLIWLAAMVPGAVLVYVCWIVNPILAIAVGVLYFLMIAVISAAVKSIFTVALYRYASQGLASEGFTTDEMKGAFISRG
jgi:Family of unknown function (DUF6159)